MIEIPREFQAAAHAFTRTYLQFLDRNWLGEVLQPKLAEWLTQHVKAHTSATSNIALREACSHARVCIENARTHMPRDAKRCCCDALDDGEHRPQPLCPWCSLGEAMNQLKLALVAP